MAGISLLAKRFSELALQLEEVEATKRQVHTLGMEGIYVDKSKFLNWKVKARNLISMACGKDSEHYTRFVECEQPSMYRTNHDELIDQKAVFYAAKDDYEGGYLNSIRNLIQAEVFDSELDQARGLLSAGYRVAAAVIAGVVLETAVRQLCTDRGIPLGKLDKMNADLAKGGAYNLLVQKRITALADVRNNAAHGHPEQFRDADIVDMIAYIENFVSEQL